MGFIRRGFARELYRRSTTFERIQGHVFVDPIGEIPCLEHRVKFHRIEIDYYIGIIRGLLQLPTAARG